MDPVSADRQLIAFSLDAELRLPAEFPPVLRTCLLDFIGIAAFSGRFVESSASFRAFERMGVGAGEQTVIGDSQGYAAPYAALLNGAFAHSLDFDDTNKVSALHPGAPVIAAALAQAERLDSSGADFLDAIAVGYEVCCRIGAALTTAGYDRGFHMTAIGGIFGAVAAAGRLARVSEDVLASAFGLAGSHASGSMQYLANGAWNKRLHPGTAAHDALIALAMAEGRALGAADPITGQYGLLRTHTERAEPERLTDGLGDVWIAVDTAIKPYPSCRLTHSAIDAALAVRDEFDAGEQDAADLELVVSPTALKIVGEAVENKIAPSNVVDGQFSIFFQTASAWLDGRPSWDSYRRIGDPVLEGVSRRMTVTADAGLAPLTCTLAVRSGSKAREVRIDEPLGEPSRPILWDATLAKYRDLADPVFGAERARAIADAVTAIDKHDVRSFTALLKA